MEKRGLVGFVVVAIVVLIFIVGLVVVWNFLGGITGSVVEEIDGFGGPSAEDIACLEACIVVGCEQGDEECVAANRRIVKSVRRNVAWSRSRLMLTRVKLVCRSVF